MKSVFIMKNI